MRLVGCKFDCKDNLKDAWSNGGSMNRFVRIGLLMTLVVVLFGTYRFVSAQERESGPPTSVQAPENVGLEQPPPVLATNHVLKATYNTEAEPSLGVPFSSGFTAIDGVSSISCPAPLGKTCTVEAEITVQATGSGEIGLCFAMDGSFPQGCPTAGTLGNYAIYSWSETVHGVAKGSHNVQSVIDSNGAGDFGFYNIDYKVYLP
jgi:hypothetical protein